MTKKEIIKKVKNLDGNFTSGYFPTVEEIEGYDIKNDPIYFPIIAYFALSPLVRAGVQPKDPMEYARTVTHCKKILKELLEENA